MKEIECENLNMKIIELERIRISDQLETRDLILEIKGRYKEQSDCLKLRYKEYKELSRNLQERLLESESKLSLLINEMNETQRTIIEYQQIIEEQKNDAKGALSQLLLEREELDQLKRIQQETQQLLQTKDNLSIIEKYKENIIANMNDSNKIEINVNDSNRQINELDDLSEDSKGDADTRRKEVVELRGDVQFLFEENKELKNRMIQENSERIDQEEKIRIKYELKAEQSDNEVSHQRKQLNNRHQELLEEEARNKKEMEQFQNKIMIQTEVDKKKLMECWAEESNNLRIQLEECKHKSKKLEEKWNSERLLLEEEWRAKRENYEETIGKKQEEIKSKEVEIKEKDMFMKKQIDKLENELRGKSILVEETVEARKKEVEILSATTTDIRTDNTRCLDALSEITKKYEEMKLRYSEDQQDGKHALDQMKHKSMRDIEKLDLEVNRFKQDTEKLMVELEKSKEEIKYLRQEKTKDDSQLEEVRKKSSVLRKEQELTQNKEIQLDTKEKEQIKKQEELIKKEDKLQHREKLLHKFDDELTQKEEKLHTRRSQIFEREDKLDTREKRLEEKAKTIQMRWNEIEEKEKGVELKEKKLDERGKQLLLKEKDNEERGGVFLQKEMKFDETIRQFKQIERDLEERIRLFQLKERDLEEKVRSLQLKERDLEEIVIQFQQKERDFEKRVRSFQVKERDLMERLRQFQLKEREFEERVRQFQLKERDLDDRERSLQMKERELEVRERSFQLKERDLEERERSFQLKERDFGDRGEVVKSKENEIQDNEERVELKNSIRQELQIECLSNSNKIRNLLENKVQKSMEDQSLRDRIKLNNEMAYEKNLKRVQEIERKQQTRLEQVSNLQRSELKDPMRSSSFLKSSEINSHQILKYSNQIQKSMDGIQFKLHQKQNTLGEFNQQLYTSNSPQYGLRDNNYNSVQESGQIIGKAKPFSPDSKAHSIHRKTQSYLSGQPEKPLQVLKLEVFKQKLRLSEPRKHSRDNYISPSQSQPLSCSNKQNISQRNYQLFNNVLHNYSYLSPNRDFSSSTKSDISPNQFFISSRGNSAKCKQTNNGLDIQDL